MEVRPHKPQFTDPLLSCGFFSLRSIKPNKPLSLSLFLCSCILTTTCMFQYRPYTLSLPSVTIKSPGHIVSQNSHSRGYKTLHALLHTCVTGQRESRTVPRRRRSKTTRAPDTQAHTLLRANVLLAISLSVSVLQPPLRACFGAAHAAVSLFSARDLSLGPPLLLPGLYIYTYVYASAFDAARFDVYSCMCVYVSVHV